MTTVPPNMAISRISELAASALSKLQRTYSQALGAPPHTLPQAVPHGVPHDPPHEGPHSLLLLKKKIEEEKETNSLSFLNIEKSAQEQDSIPEQFFKELAEGYRTNWPTLLKLGFDVDSLMQAAQACSSKALLMRTCRQSLYYAEYELRYQGTPKRKGQRVDSAKDWIFGCFKRSGQYPRPENYKSPEELAHEAALEIERQKEEARLQSAFELWRKQYSISELCELTQYKYGNPPEPILRTYFRQNEWPRPAEQTTFRG